jgi:hypothetical protein
VITLEELKKELLADPGVAAEYEALKPKYAKIQAQIEKRRKARLARAAESELPLSVPLE